MPSDPATPFKGVYLKELKSRSQRDIAIPELFVVHEGNTQISIYIFK